jgi:transcriptional regulator with XRE-family HTH domain
LSVGTVIAEKRKYCGLTQEQFSERLGVARQTVSSWENDIFLPDTTKIIQMASLFNCTTDDLLNPPRTSGSKVQEAVQVAAALSE